MEDKWQPIETAPKDGTWVLLYKRGEKRAKNKYLYRIGHWGKGNYSFGKLRWIGPSGKFNPTHWMPLPKPPTK